MKHTFLSVLIAANAVVRYRNTELLKLQYLAN